MWDGTLCKWSEVWEEKNYFDVVWLYWEEEIECVRQVYERVSESEDRRRRGRLVV